MKFKDKSITYPLPDDSLLAERESKWRINLPGLFKEFIKKYNGGSPLKDSFECNNHIYLFN